MFGINRIMQEARSFMRLLQILGLINTKDGP